MPKKFYEIKCWPLKSLKAVAAASVMSSNFNLQNSDNRERTFQQGRPNESDGSAVPITSIGLEVMSNCAPVVQ
jgi:hypothetical protein